MPVNQIETARDSSSTIGESMYDILRRSIVSLQLKPGSLMSIKDICEHYGAGRSPVRDALIRLEQDGLIASLPQRGTMISRIDFSRVEQERFLRYSVEEQVMMEFLACHTPSDFQQLEQKIWDQEDCIKRNDFRGFLDADDAFHTVFYEAANRLFCSETIRNVSGHYSRIRLLTCIDSKLSRNVVLQHKELLTALRARDAALVQEIFSRHLSRVSIEEHMFSKKYPDLFVNSKEEEQNHNSWSTDFLKTLDLEKL